MFCFFVWYFPVIKKLSALFLVCRIIKISFRLWETRQLWEHNIRAVLKISVQWSASRVQRPASSVQSPASRAQRPEFSIQVLRPEPRNSDMPWHEIFFSWTFDLLLIDSRYLAIGVYFSPHQRNIICKARAKREKLFIKTFSYYGFAICFL